MKKIEAIQQIKNIGKFSNCQIAGCQFNDNTIIYGKNTLGKSPPLPRESFRVVTKPFTHFSTHVTSLFFRVHLVVSLFGNLLLA
jgi:hypothetical protein